MELELCRRMLQPVFATMLQKSVADLSDLADIVLSELFL